ncbi:MAG: YbhB/YbcL family Raf kinase inhibitor-like protein [Xanthomonadales bacterium]|nr:YbhB/YbcL family Raf kinase inhibitor-like protein [Xanthomonadales bacterium]ODV26091.1 MAG: phospholipid-binding protein [Rhodanobacter sp. SCN 68-63]OJY85376.1 MAG: phospholipid-binding protein [Xanthomonadales bacterium 66-474]
MQIRSDSFANNARIPAEYAFGKPGNPVELSANRNPQLAWSGAPAGTRSFALACIDVDVPSRGDDVNQQGRTVPAELPRVDFAHWLMVDIPPTCTGIAAGACSDGITPRGKRDPHGPPGSRQGRNDYTGWFAADPDMAGDYLGYDGPCPPWNDARLHHYHFRVYALDIARLDLAQDFGWPELQDALRGHVLSEAEIVGTYSLNPAVR